VPVRHVQDLADPCRAQTRQRAAHDIGAFVVGETARRRDESAHVPTSMRIDDEADPRLARRGEVKSAQE
jgi:hypothetical protein